MPIKKSTEKFIGGIFDYDFCKKLWELRHPDIPYPEGEESGGKLI